MSEVDLGWGLMTKLGTSQHVARLKKNVTQSKQHISFQNNNNNPTTRIGAGDLDEHQLTKYCLTV